MSNSKEVEVVRILSIDGGGIRGIIPLSILKYIEENTHTPIHKLFNIIGGTSTGGIIALGLNCKTPANQIYSAQDILDFYVNDAHKIFRTNNDSSLEAGLSWFRDKITSKILGIKELAGKRGSGVFTPEYSGKHIENFLKDKFGSEIKLSQLSTECDVTVYSYDIENDEAYHFNNKEVATNHYYVWQAARGTSAAPSFFSGLEVYDSNSGGRSQSSKKRTLVDGGIFINNPAMALFIRAKILYPNAKKIVLVSLGTGNFKERHPELKKAGILGWLRPLISYMMKGVSITVDDHLKKLLVTSPDSIPSSLNDESSYYRFECDFDENIELDAIDKSDIRILQDLGNKLVEHKKSELSKLADQLKSYL